MFLRVQAQLEIEVGGVAQLPWKVWNVSKSCLVDSEKRQIGSLCTGGRPHENAAGETQVI